MHLRALSYLVDGLFVITDCETHEIQIIRQVFPDDSAICSIMAGFEHILDVDRHVDPTGQRTRVDLLQSRSVRNKHDHRLNDERAIGLPVRILIALTKKFGVRAKDTTCQERRNIQLLLVQQIIPHDQRDLRVKHMVSLQYL